MAGEMEVDYEARSEATFQFKVDNISSIKDPVLSEPCIVRNLPWRIEFLPVMVKVCLYNMLRVNSRLKYT